MASNDPSKVIDPYKAQTGYVEATDWAIPYWAAYLEENNIANPELFSHVNCGYLSTPGRPPTLAALKQHAQSLAHLISTIAPSQGPGEINNANAGTAGAKGFAEGEAWDWLNNLQEAYATDDPAHHRPLNSLCNQARANSDIKGVEFHCPLDVPDTPKSIRVEDAEQETNYLGERTTRPFARHWNLLRHANECLEILDHDFSATGGLLSILPTEGEAEAEQLDLAKNTLLGQYLVWTQALANRMHNLEINYSNALQALAGEAFIPPQHLSHQGPDGRSGREIVFPQDRWILANAGDDVQDFIHQVLDKRQAAEDYTMQSNRETGVVGEVIWDDATDSERGLVSTDLITRFYRVRGSAGDRGPIFVLPAFSDRPNTKHTRQMEDRPTVVGVPMPLEQGTASSQLHENYLKKMRESEQKIDCIAVKAENEKLKEELEVANEKFDQEITKNSAMHTVAANKGLAKTVRKVQDLEWELGQARKARTAAETKQQEAEELHRTLLKTTYATAAAGAAAVPRDVDGNVTEDALQALLTSLRKVFDDNNDLKATVTDLQGEIRKLVAAEKAAAKP